MIDMNTEKPCSNPRSAMDDRPRISRERETLTRLSELILRARSKGELLTETMNLIAETMRMRWAALFLWSEEGNRLLLAAEKGLAPDVRLRIQDQPVAPTSPGLAGRCAANRKTLVEDTRGNEAESSSGAVASTYLAEGGEAACLVAQPLMARGHMVGVLELGSETRSSLEREDLELLLVLGDRLAGELESQRLEGEVRAARDYLEKILSSSPDAIMILDESDALIYLNSGAENLLGERQTRLHGQPFASFLRGGEIDLGLLKEKLRAESRVSGHEAALISPSGATIPVSLSLSRLEEGAGEKPSGLLLVARDLRELRQLEDEARRRNQFLANVLTDSADAIIAIDINDRVITWNRGAERIFGYTAEEMLGKPFYPIVPRELRDAGEPALLNALIRRRGMVQGYETRRVARDGRELRVSLTRTAVRDHQGKIIGSSAVVRDITEVKELEQKLIQTERLAAIGMMSTKVAHDIRNPLSSLLLNAELLEDELMALGADHTTEARSLLRSVQAELDRLTDITEDYLQFARLPQLKFEYCQVNEIIASLLELLDESLERGRIRTHCELDPGLPEIHGDRGQLRRAFLNIFRNAIEAMPHGGTLSLETQAVGQEVRISLSDTGVGIRTGELPHIFSPFYSTKDVGTGLGLAVSQQIVHEHRGRISCRSSPRQGTTFHIWLPRERGTSREED